MEYHCHANKGRVKYPPRAHCRAETHWDRTKDAKHGARGGISYYVVARTRPIVTATLARRTAAAPGSCRQEGKIARRTNLPRFNCILFILFGDNRGRSSRIPTEEKFQLSLCSISAIKHILPVAASNN